MESLLFVALAPLAALLMLVVGLVAWRRRDAPGGWPLVAFSVAEAGWLICDAVSVATASPEATVRLAQATFLWAPLVGVAWFAFVLSYTDRLTRGARVAVGALAAWSVVYGGFALTNGAHRLVWSAWELTPDGPFLGVTYTFGPLAWAQTGMMWTAVTVSLGVMLWAYAGTDPRSRDLSRWIVVGALVPLAINVVHLLGLGPVTKDFTPIVMAISSGAFALGLVRYQLLDLTPIARATLVDDLREGMLVLDDRGRVADLNPALRRALGEGGAVLGRPLDETAPALARAVDAAPTESVRLRGRHYDLRVSPLSDRAGHPTGRLVLLHDVTRQREERAALHRANADLYHANAELQTRNDELDAFAHTVAHDLKNSVQGVIGWAEILRDEGAGLPHAEHHELADGVARAAQKMGTVVHELLLLAGVRRATVEPRPLAMDEIVDEALGRLRQAGTEAVEPAGRPARWPVAVGHAPWVEEIWVNYLSNAAKYGGPTVTLGADVVETGQARFWVHDDGPGLSPEVQPALFAAFARGEATEADGHGLGLSIVRRIADRLDGTCGVESAPGAGTRFWFALPLAPGPVEAVQPALALA